MHIQGFRVKWFKGRSIPHSHAYLGDQIHSKVQCEFEHFHRPKLLGCSDSLKQAEESIMVMRSKAVLVNT